MNPDLKTKLMEVHKLTEEQVGKLIELGVTEEDDLRLLTFDDLQTTVGLAAIPARKLIQAFAPIVTAPVVTAGAAGPIDPNAEIPEGAKPSAEMVNSFATATGIDPSMLMMMLMGNVGGDMDLTGIIPIETMIAGYNPKVRNMFLTVLGKVEERHRAPIIVINSNGSVNKEMTVEYITGLDEGRDPAEGNIYYDTAGNPFEIIGVGVDAQSIYDADPINPTKALQQNGMGVGRVNWTNVPLEVRQVAFYAATQTGEIRSDDETDHSWLRDHIKQNTNKLVFSGKAPKAVAAFNAAYRTGSLPTLRVMLSRSPRRPETGPRRRSVEPRGIGEPL